MKSLNVLKHQLLTRHPLVFNCFYPFYLLSFIHNACILFKSLCMLGKAYEFIIIIIIITIFNIIVFVIIINININRSDNLCG